MGLRGTRYRLGFTPDEGILVGVAQLVRAPDCGSGGRRFNSARPPFFGFSNRAGSGRETPPEEIPAHGVDTFKNLVIL